MTQLSKKEQTHVRILDSASAMIRKDGFEALAVAAVMKQTGLTHGGFYAHFANRDALLSEALGHASQHMLAEVKARLDASAEPSVATFIELYLSDAHRNACWHGGGCPLAALGSEISRLNQHGRQIAGSGIQSYIELLVQLSGDALKPTQAFLLLASLVGVLQLSRSLSDENEALALLQSSRQQLTAAYGGL